MRFANRLLAGAALLALALPVLADEPLRLKMRVAVAPLDWTDASIGDWSVPGEFQTALYEKLVKKLLDTGRFVVLERESLDALLQEQAITEENTGQSQAGKIVPAQALVQAKVTDFSLANKGGGGGISIGPIAVGGRLTEAKTGLNVRIFDVETSELLASETATGTASSKSFAIGANIGSAFTTFDAFEQSPLGDATNKALDKAVEQILGKLKERPWSARVADWDEASSELILNAGGESGVRAGDVFEVHRVTRIVKDPDTGKVITRRTQKIGTIKVVEVEAKFAIATLIEGEGFEVGDQVLQPKAP